MALRFSSAFANFIASLGSYKDVFDDGVIEVYSGTQPATADAAVTGTLLFSLTSGGSAKTNEVRAQGSVTLTGGASGSVDTLTVNSIEIMGSATAFNTSLTQTAADVALKINRNPRNKLFVASSVGAVITLTAVPGLGTLANGWVVATGVTTITKTDVNIGTTTAGVNSANGLRVDYNAAAGVFTKDITQTWSGTAVATGVAGWFRYKSSVVDAGSLDSSAVFNRMDGNIATSGSNMDMTNTNIVVSSVQTLNTFEFTVPTV